LATEQELSDFLKSVEKRAFKRSIYHVRNEESALDIVQDSMMKLAEHYGLDGKRPKERFFPTLVTLNRLEMTAISIFWKL
jgi:DNA-directed RNA polymerase specialized sigma24 family protein